MSGAGEGTPPSPRTPKKQTSFAPANFGSVWEGRRPGAPGTRKRGGALRPGRPARPTSRAPGPTLTLLCPQPARLARGLPGAPFSRAAPGAVTLDAGLVGHGGGRGLPAPKLSAAAASGPGRRLQEVAAPPTAPARHQPATSSRPAPRGLWRSDAPGLPPPPARCLVGGRAGPGSPVLTSVLCSGSLPSALVAASSAPPW